MEVDIKIFDAGYCTHLERMIMKGGRYKVKKFPAMFMLITHPEYGYILFDTGYSERFFNETKSFPNKLYARLTPVFLKEEDLAISKLNEVGVVPEEISYVLISHFHADHVAAVGDFPNAKFIYMKGAYDNLRAKRPFGQLLNGFLPGLLPSDFEKRSLYLEQTQKTDKLNLSISKYFSDGFDVFGDGSLVCVELPGHYQGQVGLYLKSDGKEFFLIADSVWSMKQVKHNLMPHFISKIANESMKDYKKTLNSLHHIYQESPELEMIPSHCGECMLKYVKQTKWDTEGLVGV